MKKLIGMVLCGAVLSSPALAGGKWNGTVDLGASAATGNSETISVNGSAKMIYEDRLFKHTYRAQANYAEDAAATTAERYMLGAKFAIKFGDANYAFADFEAERDEFSGFRDRGSANLGYGRRWFETEAGSSFDTEIGGGMRYTKDQLGADEWEPVGRAHFAYVGVLSDSATLEQAITVEGGSEAVLTESDTALRLTVLKSLFVKLGVEVRHNTDAPVGTKSIDTLSTVSLGYKFGG